MVLVDEATDVDEKVVGHSHFLSCMLIGRLVACDP